MLLPPALTVSHPCYGIYVRGCSEEVYGVIGQWQQYEYAKLFADHLLAKHPRQDNNSLKHMRRMKSHWSWDDDSYHWIDLKQGPSEPTHADEFVIVGVLEEPLRSID